MNKLRPDEEVINYVERDSLSHPDPVNEAHSNVRSVRFRGQCSGLLHSHLLHLLKRQNSFCLSIRLADSLKREAGPSL